MTQTTLLRQRKMKRRQMRKFRSHSMTHQRVMQTQRWTASVTAQGQRPSDPAARRCPTNAPAAAAAVGFQLTLAAAGQLPPVPTTELLLVVRERRRQMPEGKLVRMLSRRLMRISMHHGMRNQWRS
jgi:hypothetical protein